MEAVVAKISREDAVKQVTQRIQNCRPGGISLSVVIEEVCQRNGYWRVPVRPDTPPPSLIAYTDFLADLEGELQDKAGLPIHLVPAEPIPTE